MMRRSRREFIRTSIASCGAAALGSSSCVPRVHQNVTRQVLTSGPEHHWFGYYDKLQFGPSDRRILSNRVTFEHRSPEPEDSIEVGYVDLNADGAWVSLGTSSAWNWQQGCMLQWIPGQEQVIWNDRVGDRFVSRLSNPGTGLTRRLPHPVSTISGDGQTALTVDFSRLHDMRPGYGYAGIPDPSAGVMAPDASGVWRMDLGSGKRELIISVAEVASFGRSPPTDSSAKHYLNMPLVSPDGSRVAFLHRWRANRGKAKRWKTRLITCDLDGRDAFALIPYGYASHFIWRDPSHICCWTQLPGGRRAFYVLEDRTRVATPIGVQVMSRDGHVSYLPTGSGREWLVCDSYPDLLRRQVVYLYHGPTGRRVDVGVFWAPLKYRGEWRCDTHPRSSRDGRLICVDAPTSEGRQLHMLEVTGILEDVSY